MKTRCSQRRDSQFFQLYGIKSKLAFAAAGVSLALISGCDSSGITSMANDSTDAVRPDVTASLDVSAMMTRTTQTSPLDNLLINGGFEQGLSGWQSCDSNRSTKIIGDASQGSSAALVKSQNCVQQAVEIIAGETLVLACDARMKSKRNDWTGLGISFYDEFWNFIDEPAASTVQGDSYKTYTVTGLAPDNANHVAVWLYTENQAILDNCILQYASEPPPPPPPPSGNLLANGDFNEGGETATGWNDRCNGNYQRTNSFDSAIKVGGGACVHHRPGNDVLAALQGNYFAYSCEYTKSSDSYASIATNLTSKRDETGQNDVAILPRTYFGGVPTWQFETVTLYGKAKDYLAPGDIFVSVGDQGDSGLLVLGCSLEIVSGQTYSIGDTGPAGGVVFSVSDDGMHGLEVAPDDIQGRWCSSAVLDNNIADSDIIGIDNIPDINTPDNRTGAYNTDRINSKCVGPEVLSQKARAYVWPDGQAGGFMPNKDELNLLFQQKDIAGVINSERTVYASSSEAQFSNQYGNEGEFYWGQDFFTENVAARPYNKMTLPNVRSVRTF